MRRVVMCAALLAIAFVGALSAQTMKVTNLDDYKKAMQAIGAGFGGSMKALGSGDTASAKMGVASAKANMEAVHAFFVEKKKDDLAMLAKDAVDKLAAAETALNGTDAAAAGAAVKAVGGTCGACHTKYRDQDPTTKAYSFKPGTI
jgi:cytochrome c556